MTSTFADLDGSLDRASAVCLGTGRFLRAMLVPALHEIGCAVVLVQPRGLSFCNYIERRRWSGAGTTYELDTVRRDGSTTTTTHPVAACGSLALGRAAFLALPSRLRQLRYIGIGVTEAGVVHNAPAMLALAEFLHGCRAAGRAADRPPLSVLCTDNVPYNGDAIRDHVLGCDFTRSLDDTEAFCGWLTASVVFHNTMVDRITSQVWAGWVWLGIIRACTRVWSTT